LRPSGFQGFGAGVIDFYLELEQHNTREWFTANRARYDSEIATPLKALSAELETYYAPIRVFRPYRNTRFWPELPPLNEHASLVGGSGEAAVWYLRVDADGLLISAGSWHPERQHLAHLRTVLASPAGASQAREVLAEAGAAGFSLEDEFALKTAPRGYSKDHPNIDLLRLRDFSLARHHQPGPWLTSPECLERITQDWQALSPWVSWLRSNIGSAQLN